ncbi:MAG: hypothetical protein Q8O13_10695 [Candidatus Omnitrophota bacterium]|nr:hypothetical protein [Candidatus Omnitrophota bacterium]
MINEINLNVTVPETGLCISQMQPFVELVGSEPYRWQQDKKSQQLDRISRFMNIAMGFDDTGKSHFTVLPEYSIPGIEGIEKVNQFLTDVSWASETIVIGGVDGLSKNEYTTICNNTISIVSPDNAPNQIADGKWINCCITWVKDRNGDVRRWIQPKLSPSWSERRITHSEMFCGRSVNLFTIKFTNNTECKFFSLICFDWIGAINGAGNGVFEVLNKINQLWQASNSKKDINLVFVLQCNDEPNHRNFLENACNYFEDRRTNPFITRDQSILLFMNTAGLDKPGKTSRYGFSSLIASPLSPFDNNNCCPLCFSSDTTKLRNSDNLGRCEEALFRENGACFHLFNFRPPSFIPTNPGNRCLFLDEAKVYSIDDGIDDPRVPGGPVAASIKWVNDEIDTIEPITLRIQNYHVQREVNQSHENLSKEIRKVTAEHLCKYVQYSYCKYTNSDDKIVPVIHFVDKWDDGEKVGLQTVIKTLSIIGTCNTLNISGATGHSTMTIGTNVIDIIVVHGGKDHKECLEYGKKFLPSPARYAIVITKDLEDTLLDAKTDRSILNNQEPFSERGPNITNPDDRFIHRGYQNIKECYRGATSVDNLKEQLARLLGV